MNEDKSNKYIKCSVILLLIAIYFITMGMSFAFIQYIRTSKEINTIEMGNLIFSMIDGEDIKITNAFPLSDKDAFLTQPYIFTVNNKSSNKIPISYNLFFLDNNKSNTSSYFTNDQIKYNLIKNDIYVVDTLKDVGKKLSSIDGFNKNNTTGEGIVLENQSIASGRTDTYKLRIWISDDVNYSSNIDESGLATGKYNDYQYSLKIKVIATV